MVTCTGTGPSLPFPSWRSQGLCCSFLTGTPHVSAGKTLSTLETTGPTSQPLSTGTSAVHASLLDMRRSVAELRLQLQQIRQLQVPAVFLVGDVFCPSCPKSAFSSSSRTPSPTAPSQASSRHSSCILKARMVEPCRHGFLAHAHNLGLEPSTATVANG